MLVEKLLISHKSITVDSITQLAEKASQISTSRFLNDEKIGKLVILTQSLGSNKEQLLTNVYNNFKTTIKSITKDFNISLENYQFEVVIIGGMIVSNPRAILSSTTKNYQCCRSCSCFKYF